MKSIWLLLVAKQLRDRFPTPDLDRFVELGWSNLYPFVSDCGCLKEGSVARQSSPDQWRFTPSTTLNWVADMLVDSSKQCCPRFWGSQLNFIEFYCFVLSPFFQKIRKWTVLVSHLFSRCCRKTVLLRYSEQVMLIGQLIGGCFYKQPPPKDLLWSLSIPTSDHYSSLNRWCRWVRGANPADFR